VVEARKRPQRVEAAVPIGLEQPVQMLTAHLGPAAAAVTDRCLAMTLKTRGPGNGTVEAVSGPPGTPVKPEPTMSVSQSVSTILRHHVSLEVESLDRLYLNVYVPTLQRVPGVLRFFRDHRRQPIASSALMAPISAAFVAAIKAFAQAEGVPLVDFKRGQRKDDIAKAHLARFSADEGVLFVGRAQEKVSVFRTEKRRNRTTGRPYAWIVRSTAIVNQYYIYAVDRDFGPFFVKFSSYFPYTGRLCVNGHEYAKRQLARAGVAFEPLDNGFRACADPERLQAICDGLTPPRIEALLAKWLVRLPNPFSAADRAAGYRYELSVLQAEVSLTQVFDRPRRSPRPGSDRG
jgi:hypothetical protein